MYLELTRRAHVGALAAGAVWLVVVAVLTSAGHLQGFDQHLAQVLGGLFPAAAPARLLAVVVEAPSPFSREASPRERTALVEALLAAQPRAVGIESSFLYRPPDCSDEEYARLLQAVARLDHVVLAMSPDLAAEGGPAPAWGQVASRLAETPGPGADEQTPWVVQVLPTGRASRFTPYPVALVAESLGARGPLEEKPRGTVQLGSLRLPVDERGQALLRPVRWPRWHWVPAAQLQWPQAAEELRGAIVLVGSGVSPLASTGPAAPGPQGARQPSAGPVGVAQATADQVVRILAGKGVTVVPVAYSLLLAAVIGLALAGWLTRAAPTAKALAVGGAVLVTLSAVSATYVVYNVFLPPSAILLSVLGCAVLGLWWEAVCVQGWLQKEVAVRSALLPEAVRTSSLRAPRDESAAALAAAVRWVEVPAVGLFVADRRTGGALLVASAEGGTQWTDDPVVASACRSVVSSGQRAEGTWQRGEVSTEAVFAPLSAAGRTSGAVVIAVPQCGLSPQAEAYLQREARLALEAAQGDRGRAGAAVHPAGHPRSADLCATQAALEATRAAAESRAHLVEGALGAAADAVVLFGLDGRLLFRNEQAESLLACGGHPEQMDAVTLLARAWHRPRSEVQHVLGELLVSGEPVAQEVGVNGRSYLVSVAPVDRSALAAAAIAVTCVDVTRMTEAAQLREELMSVATHELRTPLTSIVGYAELLSEDTPEDDPRRPYIAGLTRQAEQLAAIIDDFLQTSRLEAQKEELCLEPVELGMLAEGTVGSLQPMAQAREIRLSLDPVPADTVVVGDALRVERVLVNLIGNAIKYSPNGAAVTVTVEMDGEYGVLRVKDTGIGIPEKDLGRVFEKFYRVRRPETANVRGTGLGLSLAKLIAEAHGGSVGAASVVGVGSVFEVRLPVGGPEETAPGPTRTDTGDGPPASGTEPGCA